MKRMKAVADDLVARARAGDDTAFQALVETHSRAVFRLAFRITRNEEDAEDTVQETFIRAYEKLPSFEARSSFGTWLYRVTANMAIDVVRRRRRSEERSAPLEPEAHGAEPRQERAVFGRQVRDRVVEALDELSDLERSAFVLRHFQDQSLKEVSASLQVSVSATKQALFRAVRKLRKSLAPIERSVP